MSGLRSWFTLKQPESDRLLGLETEAEYRQRWISIRVIYFTGFVVYIAFGIVATALWPFLKSLDPDAEKTFLTYVFAMPSVLQLVCSPAFGWWINRSSSIRISMVFFLVTFIVGQVVYVVLEDIPSDRKYFMLLSRGLVGLSTVSCTIYRAYMSSATTVAERTKAMSFLSLAQTGGLLAASAVQPIFSLLGEEGFRIGWLRVNMYTSVGWFCILLGGINLLLMLPCIFKDSAIALKEAKIGQNMATDVKVWKSMKIRYLPINLMLAAFALLMFVYTAIQTWRVASTTKTMLSSESCQLPTSRLAAIRLEPFG